MLATPGNFFKKILIMKKNAEFSFSVNFTKQYYDLVDRYDATDEASAMSLFEFVDYFEENLFTVKKISRENLIQFREASNPDWGLNVATSYNALEFIFVSPVKSFTFHGLAYDGANAHAKELIRNPRYPRIETPAEENLYQLAGEIHQLYLDAKSMVNTTE